ncbi:MAG TPA: hypothetical protein VMY87_11965 [Armatimonadota bacterium]|nr:hypothetical protein [Armatimonadota bacterium]
MQNVNRIGAEVRANFTDFVGYVLPGSVVIAAAGIEMVRFDQALGGPLGFQAVQTISADLERFMSSWLGILGLIALLGAAYIVGTVLKNLDSWVGPKWSLVLERSVDDMPEVAKSLRAAASQAWGLEEVADNKRLHNIAQTILRQRAPECLAWRDRYAAIGNLYGGLCCAVAVMIGLAIGIELGLWAHVGLPPMNSFPWDLAAMLTRVALGVLVIILLKVRQGAVRAHEYRLTWHAALAGLKGTSHTEVA